MRGLFKSTLSNPTHFYLAHMSSVDNEKSNLDLSNTYYSLNLRMPSTPVERFCLASPIIIWAIVLSRGDFNFSAFSMFYMYALCDFQWFNM